MAQANKKANIRFVERDWVKGLLKHSVAIVSLITAIAGFSYNA